MFFKTSLPVFSEIHLSSLSLLHVWDHMICFIETKTDCVCAVETIHEHKLNSTALNQSEQSQINFVCFTQKMVDKLIPKCRKGPGAWDYAFPSIYMIFLNSAMSLPRKCTLSKFTWSKPEPLVWTWLLVYTCMVVCRWWHQTVQPPEGFKLG